MGTFFSLKGIFGIPEGKKQHASVSEESAAIRIQFLE